MARVRAQVAATSSWRDPDGFRSPAGEVHAWLVGTNQTLCGVSLHRSQLERFPHVDWADVEPATGRDADRVREVCPRCGAASGRRRDERFWRRENPRPWARTPTGPAPREWDRAGAVALRCGVSAWGCT